MRGSLEKQYMILPRTDSDCYWEHSDGTAYDVLSLTAILSSGRKCKLFYNTRLSWAWTTAVLKQGIICGNTYEAYNAELRPYSLL